MNKEFVLMAWVADQVELEEEVIKKFAEEVIMDNMETDTEAPLFIRIIAVSDLNQLDEVREIAFVVMKQELFESGRLLDTSRKIK